MPIKPPGLKKGDKVGIVSPATRVHKKTDLIQGINKLKEWGLEPVLGKNVQKRYGYLAGTDEERVEDINTMLADPDIRGLFCTQGGYGSGRILPDIDYSLARKDPKIVTGKSDITSLHLGFQTQADLVTFYAPGISSWTRKYSTPYNEKYFKKAVFGQEPVGKIEPSENGPYVYTINSGQVEAPIVGGCVTMIVGLLGTPYELDLKGKILFLEDVRAEPWLFDFNLNQLKMAGKLDEPVGIVIGECKDCEVFEHLPDCPTGSLSFDDVLEHYIGGLDIPAFHGLPLGHGRDLATVPMGVKSYMDADKQELIITEQATA